MHGACSGNRARRRQREPLSHDKRITCVRPLGSFRPQVHGGNDGPWLGGTHGLGLGVFGGGRYDGALLFFWGLSVERTNERMVVHGKRMERGKRDDKRHERARSGAKGKQDGSRTRDKEPASQTNQHVRPGRETIRYYVAAHVSDTTTT